MLVLDDGWFGDRQSTRSSVGDWVENRIKFPYGLIGMGEAVHKLGMKLGLWIEPEMVSGDSELYRAHPDWCLGVKNRPKSVGRHQVSMFIFCH